MIGISSETVVYRATKFAAANQYPKPDISRLTIDRFKEGANSRKIEALGTLWAYLESNPPHEKLLAAEEPSASETIAPSAPYPGLDVFYSSGPYAYDAVQLTESAHQFYGYFAMYRKSWDGSGKISLTIAKIALVENALVFDEFTNAIAGTGDGLVWYQASEGFLFARGRFLHFLMRQAYGPGVFFGTIESFTPFPSFEPIMRMSGVMSGSTYQGPIPPTRFFCQRIEVGREPQTGLFDLSQIDSEEVKACLLGTPAGP